MTTLMSLLCAVGTVSLAVLIIVAVSSYYILCSTVSSINDKLDQLIDAWNKDAKEKEEK